MKLSTDEIKKIMVAEFGDKMPGGALGDCILAGIELLALFLNIGGCSSADEVRAEIRQNPTWKMCVLGEKQTQADVKEYDAYLQSCVNR